MSQQRPKPSQHGAFLNAARDLGCDESEERFDEVLRKVASSPPKPKPEPKAKDKPTKPAK